MKIRTDLLRTLYFHGLPGSAAELVIAGIPTDDRPHVLQPLDFTGFDEFVGTNGRARIVGFSLGAYSALKIAASLGMWEPKQVQRTTIHRTSRSWSMTKNGSEEQHFKGRNFSGRYTD